MALVQLPDGRFVHVPNTRPPPRGPAGWYPPGQEPPPPGPAGWYEPGTPGFDGSPAPPSPGPGRGVGLPPGGLGGVGGVPSPAPQPGVPGAPNAPAGGPALPPELGSSVTMGGAPEGTTINNTGPEIFPPTSRPLRPGMSPGPFTGGTSTDARFGPTFKAGSPMPGFEGGPTAAGVAGGAAGAIGSRLGLPGAILSGATATAPIWWPFIHGFQNNDTSLVPGGLDGSPPATSFGGGKPYDPTDRSTGYSPAPNPYGAGMPRGGFPLPAGPTASLPDAGPSGKTPQNPSSARPRAKTPAPGRRAPIPAGDVNLGYYAPTTGNARGATAMRYTDPNDPRIYKGPLSMFR